MDTSRQIDFDRLMACLGHNTDILVKLLKTFEADIPKQLADIQNAITSQNPEALDMTAHKLKSGIAIFSDSLAYLPAYELEKMGKQGQLDGAEDYYARLATEVAELKNQLDGYLATL